MPKKAGERTIDVGAQSGAQSVPDDVHNDQSPESAVPKQDEDSNVVESQVISDAALVHTPGVSGPPERPPVGEAWKWTPKKRKALALALQGFGPSEVAQKLGIHRNTVRNWSLRPEWIQALKAEVQEKQLSTKFRRITAVSMLADKLWKKATEAMDEPKLDLGKASLFLREHRDYARMEREQFGEGKEAGQGTTVQVNIAGMLGGNDAAMKQVDKTKETTETVAFKSFLTKFDPHKFAVEASNDAEAMVATTRKLLQETDLLDQVREEDLEEVRAAAEVAEAAKGRRR